MMLRKKQRLRLKIQQRKQLTKPSKRLRKLQKKLFMKFLKLQVRFLKRAKPIAANTATKAVKTGGQLAEKGLKFIREKKNKKG